MDTVGEVMRALEPQLDEDALSYYRAVVDDQPLFTAEVVAAQRSGQVTLDPDLVRRLTRELGQAFGD